MSVFRNAGRRGATTSNVRQKTIRSSRSGRADLSLIRAGFDETARQPEASTPAVQVELRDGAIGIRCFRKEDALPLYEAIRESISELTKWMVWCSPDYAAADAVSFISGCDEKWAKGDQYSFAIFSVSDATLLGSVGLNQVNRIHHFANVGYWVRSNCTRRGVATVAAGLAAKFGIQELALKRLELLVPVENESSCRVAEKIGARNEGILRKRLLLQGHQHDAYMYSLVADDLRKPALHEAQLELATA